MTNIAGHCLVVKSGKALEAGLAMVYLTCVNTIPNNLKEAFHHCGKITRDHYENFPVASWLLPDHLRPHICSIYAFARTADDFADEPGLTRHERLDRLGDWRDRLAGCTHNPEGLIFAALAETIRQFGIPVSLLDALLDAFTQDVNQSRHQTFEDLLAYSERSANPVGRLVLTLFGHRAPDLFQLSDAICTALQLTNFWQDIAVDYSRDRVYIPQEDMAEHDFAEKQLGDRQVTPAFRSVMRLLVRRTRSLFNEGSSLPERLHGRLRYELRLTWLGGRWILDRIESSDYDIFNRRPKLGKWAGAALLLRSLRPIGPVT